MGSLKIYLLLFLAWAFRAVATVISICLGAVALVAGFVLLTAWELAKLVPRRLVLIMSARRD